MECYSGQLIYQYSVAERQQYVVSDDYVTAQGQQYILVHQYDRQKRALTAQYAIALKRTYYTQNKLCFSLSYP